MKDLEQDALDLIDLATEQVRQLGTQGQTKKALSIFGQFGQETESSNAMSDSLAKNDMRQPRRPLKQNGLLPMIVETSGSLLQSAISSLMIWFWDLIRWIWKTSSANRTILVVLACSLAINGFHSYRDTIEWWQERNAGNFMARLGVRPDTVLSKAVYLKDVDAVIADTGEFELFNSSNW